MTLPDLSRSDPKRLALARRQIHNGAQWLARMANSFLQPASGNSHLDLTWSPERAALSTRKFDGPLAVELRLAQLQLQFTDDGRPVPHVLDLEDRSSAAIEAWMLVELLHRGKERDRFSKKLPYEISEPMTGDSEKYAAEELAAELALLAAWAQAASAVIAPLAKTAPLICWPEQMLFGTVAKTAAPASNGGAHVRIGFSLGDERTPEPHFLAVAENHGKVQSLRPDVVLTANRIAKDGLDAAAIGKFLEAPAFAGNG
jgi:hypothetical protein